VTACMFCNGADNHYFRLAPGRGISFEGLSPEQLVDQRRPYVQKTRESYRAFWEEHVRAEGRHEAPEGLPLTPPTFGSAE
jgi:hypothetical protein